MKADPKLRRQKYTGSKPIAVEEQVRALTAEKRGTILYRRDVKNQPDVGSPHPRT